MMESCSRALPLIDKALDRDNEIGPSAIPPDLIELFDELRPPLLRYLSSFPLALDDSEDVVQDAFLSLFQHLRCGKSVHSHRGWLFRAAHNLALKKRLRSRRNLESAASLAEAESYLQDSAPNPEDQLAANRTFERIEAVVRALPEQHRCCLYLRAEGLRYREIGEILNMSLGAVCGSLRRSLALISRSIGR